MSTFSSPIQAAAGSWHAGGRTGIAGLRGVQLGATGELQLRRGFGEYLNWDVQALASAHSKNAEQIRSSSNSSGAAYAAAVTTGLTSRWDVLRWVPFMSVGIGRYQFAGASPRIEGGHWGVPLRTGVEYLFSRNWLFTAQLTGHVVVRMGGPRLDWAQFTVGLGPCWGF